MESEHEEREKHCACQGVVARHVSTDEAGIGRPGGGEQLKDDGAFLAASDIHPVPVDDCCAVAIVPADAVQAVPATETYWKAES